MASPKPTTLALAVLRLANEGKTWPYACWKSLCVSEHLVHPTHVRAILLRLEEAGLLVSHAQHSMKVSSGFRRMFTITKTGRAFLHLMAPSRRRKAA